MKIKKTVSIFFLIAFGIFMFFGNNVKADEKNSDTTKIVLEKNINHASLSTWDEFIGPNTVVPLSYVPKLKTESGLYAFCIQPFNYTPLGKSVSFTDEKNT